MSELQDLHTILVKDESGDMKPATISIWHNNSEVPATKFQIVVADTVDPPDPPTWVKPMIGASTDNDTDWTRQNAAYGPVVTRRTYNGGMPASFATSNARSDVAAGRYTYWSWKPNIHTFPNDTAAKNAFSAFLDTIPVNHKATIVAWHEPEDDIRDGNFTIEEWKALQNSAAEILRAKGRPNLRWGICFMGPWTFDTRGPYWQYDWDTGMDWNLVDVIGIDPYLNKEGRTTSLEDLLTIPNSGAGWPVGHPSMFDRLTAYGKPISLMEWGCYNSTEAITTNWITEAYAWMLQWNQAHPADSDGRIESALWFDMWLNPLEGTEIPAYAAIVADSKIPPS